MHRSSSGRCVKKASSFLCPANCEACSQRLVHRLCFNSSRSLPELVISKGLLAVSEKTTIARNSTRAVPIGSVTIGGGYPIAVQSMTATHTQDIQATIEQVNSLASAGADVIRVA